MKAIILAADRGIRRLDVEKSTPKPLIKLSQEEVVFDKQIEALQGEGFDDISCLAGYHVEKLVEAYPSIDYQYDAEWERGDGHVPSLARHSEILSDDLMLVTGDTVFDQEAVDRLSHTDADAAFAISRFPTPKAARRAQNSLNEAELVTVEDGYFVSADSDDSLPNARLLGLSYFSAEGAEIFRTTVERLADEGDDSQSMSKLVSAFSDRVSDIDIVELDEAVQKVDDTHALARLLLGTKADTLERLDGLLEEAYVLDQVSFDIDTWETSPETMREEIRSLCPGRSVVVRSSAVAEDGWRDSQAGAYHTELDVDPLDDDALTDAVNRVARSLRSGLDPSDRDQVLVQPQVEDVAMSGVAFTRELDSGGPYTVINYDASSGRTDTVTAGQGSHQRTAYFHQELDGYGRFDENGSVAAVRRAVDELRALLDDPPLDIEFAVDDAGEVIILQVRPLTVHTGDDRYDLRDVSGEVDSVSDMVKQLNGPRPLLLGDETVFGVMPDWNPAEMIGTDPDPLAVSLYRYLITDEVWARGRAESGYRDVRPEPLMVTLAGRPYIDTLVDFNSFLPTSLPDDLGRRLVNHYVDRLGKNPHLQDKVEFEVAFTCLDFAFDGRRDQLKDAGFSGEDIETLQTHLRDLTDLIVSGDIAPIDEQRERLVELSRRRQRLLANGPTTWPETVRCVKQLLDDVREYGTLPFSILARYAFVATAFLDSLVEREVLTEAERETVAEGVPTIAGELADDMEQLRAGELDATTFFARYGHLRPGTYDICSPRYDEDPHGYFGVETELELDPLTLDRHRDSTVEGWEPSVSSEAQTIFEDARQGTQTLVDEAGFQFTVDDLFSFVVRAIPLRELAKFEFTRSLSTALTLLQRGAETEFDLARREVAALTLSELFDSVTENPSPVIEREFERAINHSRKRSRIQMQVQLPPVVCDHADLRAFEVTSEQPNYITSKTATAETVKLEEDDTVDQDNLDGRIVLIPSADPGYDWIFGADLAGLVTKYGGVASHMAIRAAEFGLPAAIGCGEVLYEDLANADILELDCGAGRIREVR